MKLHIILNKKQIKAIQRKQKVDANEKFVNIIKVGQQTNIKISRICIKKNINTLKKKISRKIYIQRILRMHYTFYQKNTGNC